MQSLVFCPDHLGVHGRGEVGIGHIPYLLGAREEAWIQAGQQETGTAVPHPDLLAG